jgi:hypothetical protein
VRRPLYGSAHRCDNPGEYKHIDGARAGAQQRPGAGIDGGPGGQHVVDQDEPPSMHGGRVAGGNAERPLDVGGPLGARQADLLGRRPYPPDGMSQRKPSARIRTRSLIH